MRRIHKFLFVPLLTVLVLYACLAFTPPMRSYALTGEKNKPVLALNRPQGPLGVTLTLRGKNFPPGQANLSFIDANNVPGVFTPPGDTSAEVLPSGVFLTTNLVLPTSGSAGTWKIVVTDSRGAINTIRYTVLAIHGQTSAGTPTLTLTLPSGASGSNITVTPAATAITTATPAASPSDSTSNNPSNSSSITFIGTNWLPKGTAVKLILYSGATPLPLLEPAPESDANGNIKGSFYMPTNLTVSTATIIATDVATGALRAQIPITITNGTVSFSSSSTLQPVPDETPITSAASTPATGPNGSNVVTNPLGKIDEAIWGVVLLIAGGMLAIAALMLILFMIPWSRNNNRRGQHTRSGQY